MDAALTSRRTVMKGEPPLEVEGLEGLSNAVYDRFISWNDPEARAREMNASLWNATQVVLREEIFSKSDALAVIGTLIAQLGDALPDLEDLQEDHPVPLEFSWEAIAGKLVMSAVMNRITSEHPEVDTIDARRAEERAQFGFVD
jgi:hypothetical protein